MLDELRALLEALLRVESQRVGTKTVHLENGLTAVVSGGTRTVYDAEAARATTSRRPAFPRSASPRPSHPVVEWKVDARVVKQLEASNPVYAEAIRRARRVEEAPWRVSVKR